jgi:hypothetical protein
MTEESGLNCAFLKKDGTQKRSMLAVRDFQTPNLTKKTIQTFKQTEPTPVLS